MNQRSTMVLIFWASIFNICQLGFSYKNVRLQDYLCGDKILLVIQKPFRGDPTITLTEDEDSAAIITQRWNITSPGFFPSNKIKYDCMFKVETPKRNPKGIYTKITLLKFRSNPLTGECLDYIQFTGNNRSPGRKYCDEIALDRQGAIPVFEDNDREMTVNIHIDRKNFIREPLELKMILTAHSECKYPGDFLCDPFEPYSCISRHFVNDNITNCMYPCRDESRCWKGGVTTTEMDATNVALSALTSLICTMLGVGFCLWICWKYWNCITVQQRAHEASAASQRRYEQPASAPNFDEVLTTNIMQVQQHHTLEITPQTPKDLPPSYESLFPDR